MRALVTGGAGFIGSHVAEALLAEGHDVVVLDDLSTGSRHNVPAGATFVEGDVRDGDILERLFRAHRPQWVSHQAAQTSVSVSTREPERDADINVMGTLHLLQAAAAHGVERFVLASTGGAIYGEVPDGQRADQTWPARPYSPYACSKLAAEAYVQCWRAAHGLDAVTLRYANVYGPRQDPHGEAGVVAIFSERILAGAPITVFAMDEAGDPGCVRDYVFVEDVVRANLWALSGRLSAPIVDVATGQPTTTADLAQRIARAAERAPDVTFGPRRPGDLRRSVLAPDPALPPPTPLDQGLARTVAWFRQRSSRGDAA